MAESSDNVELGVKQDDAESESPCCSQATDDVFIDDDKSKHETPETNHEHASRSRERRHSRRSDHRSRSHNPGYGSVTKTDLIRASAKRAERERHRNHSGENDIRMKHRHKNKLSVSIGSQRRRSYSANRRPSDEYPDYRIASPRTSRRRTGSSSPGGGSSPRQSVSTSSPKHQPHCMTGSSKTSLLSKPGMISANSSPLRGYADCMTPGGATTALLPRTHTSSGSNSYSKPAMEVAVAALVFGAGVVTLIVALIIGSNAWMIVGAISMAIGGVFIAFGAYFYISRYKPLQATRDNMEIRVVDSKHLAELSHDGFRRRIDMDL
ncbi:hypothetical protein LSH36_1465g00005 [Paralvinella palmiformis]|uniref:Uncharacterized protein n=1 Tax=Paralvinella palmiformis TaxID=53620 RepID=A0AAD9ITS9_9ANNE|nr:hypothetical protein LSH36_1465g00005 [Paralvinella palmiformis]